MFFVSVLLLLCSFFVHFLFLFCIFFALFLFLFCSYFVPFLLINKLRIVYFSKPKNLKKLTHLSISCILILIIFILWNFFPVQFFIFFLLLKFMLNLHTNYLIEFRATSKNFTCSSLKFWWAIFVMYLNRHFLMYFE